MSSKKKPQLYSGVLGEPLRVSNGVLDLVRDPELADHWKVLQNKRMAKMPALFEHYGLLKDAPNAWFCLAYMLASDHVKGFKEEIPAGRKRGESSTRGIGIALWCDVRRIQLRRTVENDRTGKTLPRITAEDACEILSESAGAYKGIKPRTLLREFNRANSKGWFNGMAGEELLALLDGAALPPEGGQN